MQNSSEMTIGKTYSTLQLSFMTELPKKAVFESTLRVWQFLILTTLAQKRTFGGIASVESQYYLLRYCTRIGVKEIFAGRKKVKIFHYITSLILNWEYFHFDQMGPFRIGGSIKAMFLLVGLLLDVFERLRIDWHKIGPDLRESLRSKYQIWLIQRQFLAIILSVLPKT